MTGVALLRAAFAQPEPVLEQCAAEPEACLVMPEALFEKAEACVAQLDASLAKLLLNACAAELDVCEAQTADITVELVASKPQAQTADEKQPASINLPRFVSSADAPRPNTPSPLTPTDGGRPARTDEPVLVKSARAEDVEENKDPNISSADTGAASQATYGNVLGEKNKSTLKTPPASSRADHFHIGTPAVEVPEDAPSHDAEPAAVASGQDNENIVRGDSPRLPPNASPEEIWLRLDMLRLRTDMLPGGLVLERDTNLTEIQCLMAEMQNIAVDSAGHSAQLQAFVKHSQIFDKLQRLSDLVERVESEYWQWCKDADMLPLDMVAKQQVYDWLVHSGEKSVILQQVAELGTRRCPGPGPPDLAGRQAAESGPPCNKFIQYGLYKSKVRRCPTCNKESKRLVAVSASELVDHRDVAVSSSEQGAEGKQVNFREGAATSIGVEAREPAFAKYAGCPNTYFRVLVLPSDLEIAKERGVPVMVSWMDGDRRHRSVATTDVFMMDHPCATAVTSTISAEWCHDTERLIPRNS